MHVHVIYVQIFKYIYKYIHVYINVYVHIYFLYTCTYVYEQITSHEYTSTHICIKIHIQKDPHMLIYLSIPAPIHL